MSDPQQTAPTSRIKAKHTAGTEARIRAEFDLDEVWKRQQKHNRQEKIRQLIEAGAKHEEVLQELKQQQQDSEELLAATTRLRERLEEEQDQKEQQ